MQNSLPSKEAVNEYKIYLFLYLLSTPEYKIKKQKLPNIIRYHDINVFSKII